MSWITTNFSGASGALLRGMPDVAAGISTLLNRIISRHILDAVVLIGCGGAPALFLRTFGLRGREPLLKDSTPE